MRWWRRSMVAAGLCLVLGAGYCTPGPDDPPSRSAPDRPDGVPVATSPSTSVGGPPPTTPERRRTFTLVATGDVLLHEPLWDQAVADAAAAGGSGHDFGPMLADIAPVVGGADVAICHLETPVAPAGGPYAGYPSFSVPPEITVALSDTGFDACTTASNHTYDRGAAGVDRTLDALDAAGLRHAGSARTPEEAAGTTLLDVGGADVALLSYTFGFNGIPAPDGQAWRSNPVDEARILADARTARDRGADVVVASLHWGDEYSHETNAQQEALAPTLIRSPDIDLLLGHHAHVVQPVTTVDGEWIVYGMGNMVSNQGAQGPDKLEGLVVRFTFTEAATGWRATSAEYAPVLTDDRGPVRVLDVARALDRPGAGRELRARLIAARDRTAEVVGRQGAAEAGLRPIEPSR